MDKYPLHRTGATGYNGTGKGTRYERGRVYPLPRSKGKEGEGEMIPSKVYFKRISEPKIGSGKIYYQLNEKTNTFDPCIVESGQYLDSEFHRLSNFLGLDKFENRRKRTRIWLFS